MNKPEIVTALAEEVKTTKKEAGVFYDAFITVIQTALANGDEVNMIGLGKFATREKKATIARNPQTGAKIEVPAKTVPYCRISKTLKDSLS